MEIEPANSLVVSLGKTLNGMPPCLCGILVVEPTSLPVVVASHANCGQPGHSGRTSMPFLVNWL